MAMLCDLGWTKQKKRDIKDIGVSNNAWRPGLLGEVTALMQTHHWTFTSRGHVWNDSKLNIYWHSLRANFKRFI